LTGNYRRPAQAARAGVVFKLTEAQSHGVFFPQGTRVEADDPASSENILFVTGMEVKIPAGQTEGQGTAVNVFPVRDEHLGKSNGRPWQSLTLKSSPVYLAQGIEASYFNPKIRVNEEEWSLVDDLLKSTPGERHFSLDSINGEIRFGTSTFGAVPSQGAEITCTSYYQVGGAAGNVAAGQINRIIDEIQGIDSSKITVTNPEPGAGGKDAEPLDRALHRAAVDLQKRYRAVSGVDFETLAIEAAPTQVARARTFTNRNLEHTTSSETGHISISVVPKTIENKPVPDDELRDTILNYLLVRRSITTRVHVVGPKYLDMAVNFKVTPKSNIAAHLLEARVKKRLQEFLHPISGGIDSSGWPFGRHVVISEIYRIIEETPGVDYCTQAGLLPSAQFVHLIFNTTVFPGPVSPGSYVEKNDGSTRFPLAEIPYAEENSILTVKGFKQGDRIVITHRDDPYLRKRLIVKSIQPDDRKELWFEPYQVEKTFPNGSIVASEDGRVRSTLGGRGLSANKNYETLRISGFSSHDTFVIKDEDGTSLTGNINISEVKRCTDRVYLEENWLPWYVEQSAQRTKSPLERGAPKGRGV
ncbi:MAG: putative baseplate assembly protein, partial [Candidatus Aminicenantes bacterium]